MLVNMIYMEHLGNQLGIEPTASLLKDLFVNTIQEWEGLNSYGFHILNMYMMGPTACTWSYDPYNWPYKWTTGVINLEVEMWAPIYNDSSGPSFLG